MKQFLVVAHIMVFTIFAVPRVQALDLTELHNGKAAISFRYRYEGVDQDGISEEAGASTLRTRFSWTSAPSDGFTIGFEADYVSVIGSEQYNSTENGETEYPVVADPEGFDLNLAYVAYATDNQKFDFGRQRIVHGSQRFVGGVAWRQNEQTFDAFRYRPTFGEWTVDYTYVWNVNRIFGPDDGAQPSDWYGDSHFLVGKRPINENHSFEVFGYMLDFENDNGLPNSSSTWGLGYAGKFGPTSINATVATQSDWADSPLDYSATFYSIQADFKLSPVTLTLGREVLGSDDGTAAFRTPLATLHKFQGWADKFLVTPANGIEDNFVGIKGKIGQVGMALTWHDFSADEGSSDYGDELNFVMNYAYNKKISFQLKAADYQADEFATDTTKIWLTTNFKL